MDLDARSDDLLRDRIICPPELLNSLFHIRSSAEDRGSCVGTSGTAQQDEDAAQPQEAEERLASFDTQPPTIAISGSTNALSVVRRGPLVEGVIPLLGPRILPEPVSNRGGGFGRSHHGMGPNFTSRA